VGTNETVAVAVRQSKRLPINEGECKTADTPERMLLLLLLGMAEQQEWPTLLAKV